MKKTIFTILLLVFSDVLLSQNHLYLVEFKENLNLNQFKMLDNNYDLIKIKNNRSDDNQKINNLSRFLDDVNPISFRKLLRKIPDNLKFLKAESGKEFSLEYLQRLYVIEISNKLNQDEIESLTQSYSIVKYIDFDEPMKVQDWPPNDQYYSEQIQFYNSPYNINLPLAYNYTYGNSSIKVGIVDHGVDYNHSDLGGGIGEGFRIRGGWDYTDNDPYPLPLYSSEGHGTPIAGIIGALNNNGVGVIGIAGGWQGIPFAGCQIFSFRVATSGGFISRALSTEAIIEASANPQYNNGFGYNVDVINCSFGSDDPIYWDWGNLSLRSNYYAYVFAYLNNVVVTAGKGNNSNTVPFYPAEFSNGNVLLSVSGVTDEGNLSSQSNYGSVTIAAPFKLNQTTGNNNTYQPFHGTSNASPFVAGVAGLVFSRFKERGITLLNDDVREILKISAIPKNDPYKYGAGLLNAGNACRISSPPFNIIHKEANLNKTVTNVSNPPQYLSIYYPFSTFIVSETKKITATVEIPDCDLNEAWVWANQLTEGFTWGNPHYGMTNATLVGQSGRYFTFETYVYRGIPVGGSQLMWYPSPPDAKIFVSILGKFNLPEPPVISTINVDKTALYWNESATFTPVITSGTGPFTYTWEIGKCGNFTHTDCLNFGSNTPQGIYYPNGFLSNTLKISNSGYVTTKCNQPFELVPCPPPPYSPPNGVYPNITIKVRLKISNSVGSYTKECSYILNPISGNRPPVVGGGGGCPYIFVYNEEASDWVVDNNILHRSEFLENEGIDIIDKYLLQVKPGVFDDKISIYVKEVSGNQNYFDKIKLYAVDHPEGTKIGITENNDIIIYDEEFINTPSEATLGKENITDYMVENDDKIVNGLGGDIIDISYDGKNGASGLFNFAFKWNTFNTGLRSDNNFALLGYISSNREPGNTDRKPVGGNVTLATGSVIYEEPFAIREISSPVFIPFGKSSESADRVEISWNTKYNVDNFVVLPIAYEGFTVSEFPLIEVSHNILGNLIEKLKYEDELYAELDSTNNLYLLFENISPPEQGMIRDYVFETIGRSVYNGGDGMMYNMSQPLNVNQKIKPDIVNELQLNFPNPFNPKTNIKYSIASSGIVKIKVFNLLGQQVTELVNEFKTPGNYHVEFDGTNLSSGVYYYRIEANGFTDLKSMILIK